MMICIITRRYRPRWVSQLSSTDGKLRFLNLYYLNLSTFQKSRNVLNGAKRLNDWNAWNGLIPVMNGAKRWNPSIGLRPGLLERLKQASLA